VTGPFRCHVAGRNLTPRTGLTYRCEPVIWALRTG